MTVRARLFPALFCASALAACAGDDPEGAVDVVAAPAGRGLGVVHSDYTSASVSLVDPKTFAVVKDNCIGSGSRAPKLSVALSGDVVLPSAPQPGGELVVIDRKVNGTITWLDPATCDVLRQVVIGDGWSSNPQDLLAVSADKAYVPRYQSNPTKADEGNDLLIIDPRDGTKKGRIALAPYATTNDTAAIQPRPARGLVHGGKVYVALNNLSADYMAAGAGRVVIVDPATDQVTGTIDPPGLENCGSIALAGEGKLLVTCSGDFGEPAKHLAGSGLALVDLTATPPAIKILPASAFGRPLEGFGGAVLPSLQGFAVLSGDPNGPPDQIYSFDLTTDAVAKVYEAGDAYVTAIRFDPTTKVLFVGDASDKKAPRVHTFTAGAGAPTRGPSFVSSPATGLPPRHFGWY
jgi:hypothetical protein